MKAWISKDRFGYYLSLTKPKYESYHGRLDFRGLKANLCNYERRNKAFPGFGSLGLGDCIRVEILPVADKISLIEGPTDEKLLSD